MPERELLPDLSFFNVSLFLFFNFKHVFCDVTLFLVKLSPRIRLIPKRERDSIWFLRHSCLTFLTNSSQKNYVINVINVSMKFSKSIKSLTKSFHGSSIRFFIYVDSVKRVSKGDLTGFSQAFVRWNGSPLLWRICAKNICPLISERYLVMYIFNQSFKKKKKLDISRFWNQLSYHSRSIFALYEINAL